MGTRQTTLAFVAACMGMVFFGITMVALGSVLPSLSAKLGLLPAQKATLAMMLTGGIFGGSLIFGPVCDYYGHKGIFIISCILVFFGITGISLAGSFGVLLPCYLAIGVGGGVLNGQTNTLTSDLFDDEHRGAKMSLLGAFYGVGGISITFLMFLFDDYAGYETILQFIAAILLLCIIFCISIKFPRTKNIQSFPFRSAFRLLRDPVLLVMSFVLMLESSVESVTNNLSTTYFAGMDNVVLLLTTNMIGITLARFVMTYLAGKVSQQRLLYCFLSILLLGFIVLTIADNFALAVTAMALIGIGTAATYPVVLGLLGGKYTTLSGTAFGIAITLALAGNTVVNMLVGGLLMNVYPYVMMLFAVLMIFLFRLGNKHLARRKSR